MIKAEDAIRTARSLIGTPYKKMDCIALIRAIIRQSPGGVKDYRCEGTNWLWDSAKNSGKYQHLTERHEGIKGIPAGALAFKRYGKDGEDHVGIATGTGTIIHSSSVNGRGVVETPLSRSEGWDCWGKHRYIEIAPAGAESEGGGMASYLYEAVVKLQDEESTLNVRSAPSGDVIGRIGHGARVRVMAEKSGWAFVSYGDSGSGYVSVKYLTPIEEETATEEAGELTIRTIIEDSAGRVFEPVGDFTVRTQLEVDGND